jgi:hypothetical protein
VLLQRLKLIDRSVRRPRGHHVAQISETRRSNRLRLAPQERYAMILKGCRATDMTSLMKTIGSMRLENNDVPHELVFRFLFLFARYRH